MRRVALAEERQRGWVRGWVLGPFVRGDDALGQVVPMVSFLPDADRLRAADDDTYLKLARTRRAAAGPCARATRATAPAARPRARRRPSRTMYQVISSEVAGVEVKQPQDRSMPRSFALTSAAAEGECLSQINSAFWFDTSADDEIHSKLAYVLQGIEMKSAQWTKTIHGANALMIEKPFRPDGGFVRRAKGGAGGLVSRALQPPL